MDGQSGQTSSAAALSPIASGIDRGLPHWGHHRLSLGLFESFPQTSVDFPDATVGIESQGNDHIHQRLHVQFFLSLLPGLAAGEHLLDDLGCNNGFQLRQAQIRADLVVSIQLRYAIGHRKVSPCEWIYIWKVFHNEVPFFFL